MAPRAVFGICKMLYHYGVFDLPLPCRLRIPREAHLETDLALPNNNVYGKVELLQNISDSKYRLFNKSGHLGPEDNTMTAMKDANQMELSDIAFDNLYPAVIECFLIILCGYVAGRGNLISQVEGKGLERFVGTFALPALVFMSMAKLNFSSVNWIFLFGLSISKAVVFFTVMAICLLVYRPINFSRAGLFAIFTTQSNDFALGYPIVAALYGKKYPQFASYLYLVAPVSLVILNPIGFILMEIGKRRQAAANSILEGRSPSRKPPCSCSLPFSIAKDILCNPVVLMTALGIIANFVFKQQLPNIIEGVLKVLGQAFSASALFLLGLRMVGKMQDLKGPGLVTPAILIAVKTLILPLVTREIVNVLNPGATHNETVDYSNYGFLYGTFPTAPGVFVFAAQYNVAVDLVATAMVAGTFLSAPLMFVSAKMVTLVSVDPYDYVKELETFMFNISIIGLICTVWVMIIFMLSSKWRKVPHFVTMCLAFSQCVACVGALMWAVMDCNHTWKLYLQFVCFSWGVFSCRLWTALLAVTLFLLRWRSLTFVLKIRWWLAVFGWGVPLVLVMALLLLVPNSSNIANKHDPNFQFGSTQAIVALMLLWFALFTTIVCLILHQRVERRYAQYESLLNLTDGEGIRRRGDDGRTGEGGRLLLNSTTSSLTSEEEIPPRENNNANEENNVERDRGDTNGVINIESHTLENIGEISDENDSLFHHNDELMVTHREQATHSNSWNESVSRQNNSTILTQPEESLIHRDRDDEFHMLRHVVLLLLLCVSMIVGFALCIWTLVAREANGVYVELVFLDVVLNFGQGFFTAAVFGLDTKLIVAPISKLWRRLVYGAPTINIPPKDKLDSTTKQVCEQFTNYHMDKCINDIVRDKKFRLKHYKDVFTGEELVDWLLLVGLCGDRTGAVKYGRRLLQGGIIRHVQQMNHFHDTPLFYLFV